MPEETSLSIGPYRVEGTIAKGNLASVLKARDPQSGRAVAVKVGGPKLRGNPEAATRFLADGEIARPLEHPNVARTFDSGMHGEDPWVAHEYVEGVSLDRLLAQRRLSLPECLTVVKAVGRGLAYAHQQGVVHGNLKPRNVLVSDDLSTVKLTDFGSGRLESAKVEAGTIATGHVSVGAVHYTAPEVVHGLGQADARSDLYSLGVIFYEVLTGRAPSGRIALPSHLVADLPSDLDPIVLKCLAQDRNQRYSSARELLADVDKLEQEQRLRLAAEIEGLSRTTRRLLGSPGKPNDAVRFPGIYIAALIAATLVVCGLVFFWMKEGSSEPVRVPPPTQAPAAQPPGAQLPATPAQPTPMEPAPAVPEPAAAQPAPVKVTSGSGSQAPAPKASAAAAPAGPSAAGTVSGTTTATDQSASAELAQALAVAREGKTDEARRLLGEVASKYAGSPEALQALVQKAALEEQKGGYQRDPRLGGSAPAALVTYRTLAESYPTAPPAEEALWKVGEMYEGLKKYDLAAQAFSDLGSRFPATRHDAWYRAGSLYDKRLKDAARAKEAYARVPAGSGKYKEAQERLKRL